jgi:hypothetical protein
LYFEAGAGLQLRRSCFVRPWDRKKIIGLGRNKPGAPKGFRRPILEKDRLVLEIGRKIPWAAGREGSVFSPG